MDKIRRLSPFLGGCAAIAVLALLLVIYNLAKPVPMAGTKTITIDVIYENGLQEHFQTTTEAQFLLNAIETIPGLKIEGVSQEDSGLLVTAINGVSADSQTDGAYWALFLDDEPCSYGVSQQAIKDGEHYTFKYTPATQKNH